MKLRHLLLLVFTIGTASVAQAHVALVSSMPVANATVVSPARITLIFSEKLNRSFSSFQLSDTRGVKVPVTAVTTGSVDGKELTVTLARALPPGRYVVNWQAVGETPEKSKGTLAFTVR